MKSIIASAALLAAIVQSQSLTSIFGQGDLVNITTILGKHADIAQMMSFAENITILAPMDGAEGLSRLLLDATDDDVSAENAINSPGNIEATLNYR